MALDDPDLPMAGIVPSKDELKNYLNVTVRQSIPELECSLLLPASWYQRPMPAERADLKKFKDETSFASLAVFTATQNFMPPVMFSVSMRPAPKEGSVSEWLERQCYLQQLALVRLKLSRFAFGLAIEGVAFQGSDVGKQKMRLTMFEDGGRLFVLTGMAPIELWAEMVPTLSLCVLTFELLKPMGQTAKVVMDPPPEDDTAGEET